MSTTTGAPHVGYRGFGRLLARRPRNALTVAGRAWKRYVTVGATAEARRLRE
jgi:hypothetical protein